MKDINLKSLVAVGGRFMHRLKPYMGVLFFILFVLVYSYLVFKINMLSSSEVDQDDVTAQVERSPTPRIDDKAAEQLESLKDNSVNVQTLFEESRTNPFGE